MSALGEHEALRVCGVRRAVPSAGCWGFGRAVSGHGLLCIFSSCARSCTCLSTGVGSKKALPWGEGSGCSGGGSHVWKGCGSSRVITSQIPETWASPAASRPRGRGRASHRERGGGGPQHVRLGGSASPSGEEPPSWDLSPPPSSLS